MITTRAVRVVCPLLAAAGLCSSQPAAGAPARPDPDPTSAAFGRQVAPVFRCIFEDRSRLVIVHPARDLYVAFNPGTCGVQKIWRGGMIYRGKVWDFSQDNCAVAPDSTVLSRARSTLARLEDSGSFGDGWAAEDVRPPANPGRAEGCTFTSPHATLTSPEFDASGWQRVFVKFDETQRDGPFRVDISSDGGATWDAQSFYSTTHGSSDTDWQFDFKTIEHPSAHMRVRWAMGPNAANKRLRRVEIFGDRVPWSFTIDGKTSIVAPKWRGYERPAGADAPVCVLMFNLGLPSGKVVEVRQEIHAGEGPTSSLREVFHLSGIPEGASIALALPELGSGHATRRVEGDCIRPTDLTAQDLHISGVHGGQCTFTLETSTKP